MRGRVKRERQSSDLAVIGDRVELERLPGRDRRHRRRRAAQHRFSRRQPGPRGTWREDVIVANPDLVAIVFACDRPPPNPAADRPLPRCRRVQRGSGDPRREQDRPRRRRCARVSDSAATSASATTCSTRARGRASGSRSSGERLAGRLSIVTGPSGVGKSTLLNAMQPGLRLETGDVSEVLDRRGRHTTTHAELHPLDGPAGGYVADTPGIRELGLFQIPDDRAGVVLPGIPRAPREVCLRRLHAPARAALRGPRRRRSRGDLG